MLHAIQDDGRGGGTGVPVYQKQDTATLERVRRAHTAPAPTAGQVYGRGAGQTVDRRRLGGGRFRPGVFAQRAAGRGHQTVKGPVVLLLRV